MKSGQPRHHAQLPVKVPSEQDWMMPSVIYPSEARRTLHRLPSQGWTKRFYINGVCLFSLDGHHQTVGSCSTIGFKAVIHGNLQAVCETVGLLSHGDDGQQFGVHFIRHTTILGCRRMTMDTVTAAVAR